MNSKKKFNVISKTLLNNYVINPHHLKIKFVKLKIKLYGQKVLKNKHAQTKRSLNNK